MFVKPAELALDRYDVIIAGSGPAGTVLGRRLADKGRTVLLVETGGAEQDQIVQDRYGPVNGTGHFGLEWWPSHWVRALGGTSAAWTGFVMPLTQRNMKDWPITRAELDPWYDIAATELRRDPIVNRHTAPFLPGFYSRPYSTEDPVRYGTDFAKGYADHPKLHVLLGTTLCRLFPRADRRGIERISLFSEPDRRSDHPLRDNQAVVLAGGGIGNAQMLLASTDGTSAAVGNEQDQVGRYLMEHPHIYSCARMVLHPSLALPVPPPTFGKHVQALLPDDALLAELGGIDIGIEPMARPLDADDAIETALVARLGGKAAAYDLSVRSEMRPDPANRVERAGGNDPSGLPRMKASCVIGADDFRAVNLTLHTLGERLAASNKGRLRIANDSIHREVTGGGHTMGTTRMGSDPRTSVTDRDCRVHGYANLYVAGSSLFTTGGCANPTLTIVALAARLADHLA